AGSRCDESSLQQLEHYITSTRYHYFYEPGYNGPEEGPFHQQMVRTSPAAPPPPPDHGSTAHQTLQAHPDREHHKVLELRTDRYPRLGSTQPSADDRDSPRRPLQYADGDPSHCQNSWRNCRIRNTASPVEPLAGQERARQGVAAFPRGSPGHRDHLRDEHQLTG